MGASNTPLPDLIEISAINAYATYTHSGAGGGTLLGIVDNATYTDGDASNSATEINELNEFDGGNAGTLTIDGVDYDIFIAVPDGSGHPVTIVHDGGTTNLTGSGGTSQIVFLQAIPTGGGATRYFIAIDDGVGDLVNIQSVQTRALDFTPAGDDVTISLEQNNTITICFTAGARIATPAGDIAVERLSAGDLVLTLDHGPQPISWIGATEVALRGGARRQRPFVIARGALGPGIPSQDLALSPQHRVLIGSPVVQRMFDTAEVIAPVAKLRQWPGIARDMAQRDRVTYWHIRFAQHQAIWANGALVESLMPSGRHRALRSLGPEVRRLRPVRPIVEDGPALRHLLARHRRNGKPLQPGYSGSVFASWAS